MKKRLIAIFTVIAMVLYCFVVFLGFLLIPIWIILWILTGWGYWNWIFNNNLYKKEFTDEKLKELFK